LHRKMVLLVTGAIHTVKMDSGELVWSLCMTPYPKWGIVREILVVLNALGNRPQGMVPWPHSHLLTPMPGTTLRGR
jgi:hypothetical protein